MDTRAEGRVASATAGGKGPTMTESQDRRGAPLPRAGRIKSPETLASGLLLLALGCIGFFGTWNLANGTLAEPEAGMLPRAVSMLVAACGMGLLASALTTSGPALESWSPRGLICVLGAAIAFGLTIRGFDLGHFKVPALGLIIAGPLAITLAALADPETRFKEIVIFAVGLTTLCIVMFRMILRLPIPIAPWLVGY